MLDRYDSLVEAYCRKYSFPSYYVKRQMFAESWDWKRSDVDPRAKSPSGAKGLMQFMPKTWKDVTKTMKGLGLLDYKPDIHNPEDSIHLGVFYDKYLNGRLMEIPDETERLKFTMASYNAGIGNINTVLSLSRASCNQPSSYAEWVRQGSPEGAWQTWDYACLQLPFVTGKNNSEQTMNYVSRIFGTYHWG